MSRTKLFVVAIIAPIVLATIAPSGAADLPWINGDFELGDATWTAPGSTTFGDADGDGDGEAKLTACGEGSWQLSRGATKGDVPATMSLAFDVERGHLSFYSFRMILLSATDPEPWANNLLNLSTDLPTYDDQHWFDDQVLAWEDWQTTPQLSGRVVLDPVEANAYNIDGWDEMDDAARTAFLGTALHMTLVVYGCSDGFEGGATLDDFAWVLG